MKPDEQEVVAELLETLERRGIVQEHAIDLGELYPGRWPLGTWITIPSFWLGEDSRRIATRRNG